MKPAKIGVIGCGMISDHYFKAAKRFPVLDMALCADLDAELAKKKGELYGVKAVSCDELLADPEIEVVLNLTPPKAHNAVAKSALLAIERGADTVTSNRPSRLLEESQPRQ